MEYLENPSLNITQFMCVMNLLHRIAIRRLPDALLQGMTVSQPVSYTHLTLPTRSTV